MHLIVERTGQIRAVYSEDIDLATLGRLAITRASVVEPDLDGRWSADLRPMVGPVLGPFDLRSEALEAERVWLETYWLSSPGSQDSHRRKGDPARQAPFDIVSRT